MGIANLITNIQYVIIYLYIFIYMYYSDVTFSISNII